MQNAYTAAVLCVAACCVAAAFLSGVQVGARAAVANGDAVPLRQLLSSRLRRLQNNGVAPSSEAAGKRYAFVQVLDDQKNLAHPYMASLFATHQRLNETGALEHADHVLMQCGHAPTHPGIKSISFDCSEIDKAVEGQGFHRHCFYKLAPLRLSYARVLILDIDIYVAADPMPVFGYPSPGMVRWDNPHSGPFQANSAVVLVQPGEQVYAAALSWLRRIPVMSQQARREKLHNMITPWGAFNNRTAATPPDALQVAAHDGEGRPQPVDLLDGEAQQLLLAHLPSPGGQSRNVDLDEVRLPPPFEPRHPSHEPGAWSLEPDPGVCAGGAVRHGRGHGALAGRR